MIRANRIASDQQSTTKQQPLIIWVYELVSIVLPFLDFVVIVFKWSNFLKPACSWYMSERGEVSQPAGPLWGSLSVRHHSRSPCNSLQNIDPAFQASRGRELSLPGNPPRPPPGRNTTAPTAPWHAGSNSLILLINVNCVVGVHTLLCQNRQKIFFFFSNFSVKVHHTPVLPSLARPMLWCRSPTLLQPSLLRDQSPISMASRLNLENLKQKQYLKISYPI